MTDVKEGAFDSDTRATRRVFLGSSLSAGLSAGALAWACNAASARPMRESPRDARDTRAARKDFPLLVGSANALAGMKLHYKSLADGADPLDVAIEVVKVTEADPNDDSVGLGGLPNEDGVVQLDAACMYGPRHKSGAVACIENILHPSEVARLVLERTDHCLLVGKGAYEFARAHGHPHVELLTEASRKKWMEWKESMSANDDRLPPPAKIPYQGALAPSRGESETLRTAAAAPGGAPLQTVPRRAPRQTGTIHCSALARDGAIACTTTTSGLAWKIPGRVGDSPIVGAGLYCDQEAGSAGSTGRGEACVLANASFAIVELMRQGASALDAGMELLARVERQTQRQSRYQPDLVGSDGLPSFDLNFYVLALDGSFAGVSLKASHEYAVSDPEHGPRLERTRTLHSR